MTANKECYPEILTDPFWDSLKNTYSCHAAFYHDKNEGGYTAVARNLPGVVTEGETVQEATENIIDAFRGALESYAACGLAIPWKVSCDSETDSGFVFEKHLLVPVDVQ